ncbi:MAG: hypothetical protein WD627_07125, partial [Actinomycetota bacterium]
MDKATRRRSPFAYLLVLALIIVSAAGALFVTRSDVDPPSFLLAAAFKWLAQENASGRQSVAEPAQAAPASEQGAAAPVEERVNAVPPSLRATIP